MSKFVGSPVEYRLDFTEEERAYLKGCFPILSRGQREILYAVCQGRDLNAGNLFAENKVIANRLGICLPTLRTQIAKINRKLGTKSKEDLVRIAGTHLIRGYRSGKVA